MSAASPRFRTSATMAATASLTSCCASRLPVRNSAKRVSNPSSRASSLCGIDRSLYPGHQVADRFGMQLERSTIHHQPRADLGDGLDFSQPVGLKRGTGLNEVDDPGAETQLSGQFHGPPPGDAV